MKSKMILIVLFSYILLMAEDNVEIKENQKPDPMIFAYDESMIKEVGGNVNTIKVAVESFVHIIDKKFSVKWFKEEDEMLKSLHDHEITCAPVMTLTYLFSKNKSIKITPLFSAGGKYSDGPHLNYVVVVKADSNFKTLNDLKGKTFARINTDEVGSLFLDLNLARLKLKEKYNEFFGQINTYDNYDLCFNSVYFGKNDACMIHENTFKLMVDMNPSLSKDMKIILKSENHVIAALFTPETINLQLKDKLLQTGLQLHETAKGRQILRLLKMNNLYAIKETDFDSVKQLLGEYKNLTGVEYETVFKSYQKSE